MLPNNPALNVLPVNEHEPDLPADILRYNATMTLTRAAEGLRSDATTLCMETDWRTNAEMAYVMRYPSGEVSSSHGYWSNMAIFMEHMGHFEGVHIIRLPLTWAEGTNGLNGFWWDEVRPTFADHPWVGEQFFRDEWRLMAELLPAPSAKFPGMVSYFQSPEKRARNIRTPMKAGKFLKKYFKDVLSEEEIQKHGLAWSNHFAVQELFIAREADEIEEVYKSAHNGSCMWFPSEDYDGDQHPARAYAGPDLATAYIKDPEDDCTGRCLVWPEKMVYYPKFYGDELRLVGALEANGYKEGSKADFTGARLTRLIYRGGTFVVPYVDTHAYATDDGDYLILDDCGPIYLRNTNGLSQELSKCSDCGDHVNPDDTTTDYFENTICTSCRDNHYFMCEGYDDYFVDVEMVMVDGESYSQRYIDNHSSRFFECTGSGETHNSRRVDSIVVDGETYSLDYVENNGWQCRVSDEWYLADDGKIELSDGSYIHEHSFASTDEFKQFLMDCDLTAEGFELELAEAA